MIIEFLNGPLAGGTFELVSAAGGASTLEAVFALIGPVTIFSLIVIAVVGPFIIWPILIMTAFESDPTLFILLAAEIAWILWRISRGGSSLVTELALNMVFLFAVLLVVAVIAFVWLFFFYDGLDPQMRQYIFEHGSEFFAHIGANLLSQLPVMLFVFAMLSALPAGIISRLS